MVHTAEHKLFRGHILDQLLSLHYVEHLPDLVLGESVNEVNLVEVDEHGVL